MAALRPLMLVASPGPPVTAAQAMLEVVEVVMEHAACMFPAHDSYSRFTNVLQLQ